MASIHPQVQAVHLARGQRRTSPYLGLRDRGGRGLDGSHGDGGVAICSEGRGTRGTHPRLGVCCSRDYMAEGVRLRSFVGPREHLDGHLRLLVARVTGVTRFPDVVTVWIGEGECSCTAVPEEDWWTGDGDGDEGVAAGGQATGREGNVMGGGGLSRGAMGRRGGCRGWGAGMAPEGTSGGKGSSLGLPLGLLFSNAHGLGGSK